jgi:hypothetical protein
MGNLLTELGVQAVRWILEVWLLPRFGVPT